VDGNTVRAQHLAGKPAPDTFLMAAKLLGADPTRSVVVENAISGVQAGRKGNFGLVIGVARKGNTAELRVAGKVVSKCTLSRNGLFSQEILDGFLTLWRWKRLDASETKPNVEDLSFQLDNRESYDEGTFYTRRF